MIRSRFGRSLWRRVGALGLAAVALVWLGAGFALSSPTDASWTNGNDQEATVSTAQLNPVTSLSCNAASGLLSSSIGFTWAQPSTTGDGLTPTGYILSWSGTAGSGQTTVTGLSGTVPGSGLSVLGTSTVTVTATYGSWQSPVSTQTRTVTTVSVLGAIVDWTCA